MLFKIHNLFFIILLIYQSTVECDNTENQEYEYDEDSLDMFPKFKPKIEENQIDLSKINKTEFCDEHCNFLISFNEKTICSQYMPESELENDIDDKESKKKNIFTADGVYFYYKSFIYSLLETIKYKGIKYDNDAYSHHLKIKIDLKKHYLDKLIIFSDYTTTIRNSSIQDLTHILKKMFYDYEEFIPESKIDILADRFQNYFGIDFASLFIVIISLILTSGVIILIIKYHLFSRSHVKQLIILLILVAFTYSAINNYYLLKQKKEIYKRAHLASKVPEECFSQSVKQEETGVFNKFKQFFKYSPTSKVCLEYAEAVMIDSVYQISLFEVVIYTIVQPFKQISIALGESINEFYTSVGKDLGFIDGPILKLFLAGVIPIISIISLVFCCCNEFKLFGGLVSLKRSNEKPQPSIEEIRRQVFDEMSKKLAIELKELKIKFKENEKLSIESLADKIKKAKNIEKSNKKHLAIESNKEDNIEKINQNKAAKVEVIGSEDENDLKRSSSSDSLIVVDD